MERTEPRVLVVTGNASLVIGLTFAHRGWDVASQTPDAEAPLDGDVLVLDLGTTRAGLVAADSLPAGARALVIGDEEPSDDASPDVQVLVRPYTVDDLTGRIDQLLSSTDEQDPVWPEHEHAAEAPVAPDASPGVGVAVAAPPSRAANRGVGGPSQPPALVRIGTGDAAAEEHSKGGETSETRRRGRRLDRHEPRRTLAARLFGRVAEEVPAESSSPADAGDPGEPEDELPGGPVVPCHASTVAADDTRVRAGTNGGVGVHATSHEGGLPGPAAEDLRSPPPPPGLVMPARTMLEHRVIHVPEVATATPPPVRPARWRARRLRAGTNPERRLRERLARVLSATSELELLVEEVPLLNELPALASAIVREVQHQLDAGTVGLWRPAEDGWRLTAHQGLTPNEATWVVPFDQPLFSEVHATGGALLLDPVDAVQAAVAGIGGAHTESFMAAAVAAGPGRYGILAVGRDRQLIEEDLDVLGDLALEMAPGLAVAEQLARLRSAGATSTPASSVSDGRRAWRAAD